MIEFSNSKFKSLITPPEPRHELTGIQAIERDIDMLRSVYINKSAETQNKQRENDKNYRRLLAKRELWVATGKLS